MVRNQRTTKEPACLPSLPGTYALVLAATACREVAIGRLGMLAVQPGFYVYVGSAMGPGGLAARIGRHRRGDKRLRWHVDYLRIVARIEEVWYAAGSRHRECRWANALRKMSGAGIPMARFGASDCRCPSHLLFFALQPSIAAFAQALAGSGLTQELRRA
jgi:Uri superfamily endonuclease